MTGSSAPSSQARARERRPVDPPAPARRPALWIVVPCMGRLVHLRRTLPLALRQGAGYCLVDYACPDRCGDWARRRYAEAVAEGRLAVESVRGATHFSKPRAHNLGAARAIREGARALLFLDADTRVGPGLVRWLRGRLRPGRFLIAGLFAGEWYVRGTGGILGVSAGDVDRAGGFDERFEGWGAEDIEMRLKLHLRGGLPFGEIPVRFFRPITHADRLRTRFYRVKDRLASYAVNRRRLDRKVRTWTGAGLAALPPRAGRLDMVPGRYRRRDGLLLRWEPPPPRRGAAPTGRPRAGAPPAPGRG